MSGDGNEVNRIRTAVRIRPLSKSEEVNEEKMIASVDFESGEIILLNPIFFESSNQSEKLRRLEERKYLCDIPLWSVDKTHPDYSGQSDVFNLIGKPLINDALEGLNCSLFAYGQTGSGKTYTMMGNSSTEEQGVIPRFCSELFSQLNLSKANSQQLINSTDPDNDLSAPCMMDSNVEVSYYEIYNERIYDLLSSTPETACKVREHPTDGAFVEGLTLRPVRNYDEIAVILEEGHSKRQVAETLMNATSSRSHAVFTLYLTQKIFIPRPKSLQKSSKVSEVIQRKSKVNLIDLAGSERLNSTGATGDRLKEATNINRSLFVLGEVIKTLSENSDKGTDGFVPYRNSLLTWILKDSLGGNSKTTMLATVSPIGPSYAESTNTLRYIERAKLVASKARVNDDNANDPYIKHLQQQVALYKGKLNSALTQLREKEAGYEKKYQQFTEETELLKTQLQEANRLSRRLSRAISAEDNVIVSNDGSGITSVTATPVKVPSFRSLPSGNSCGHLVVNLDEEDVADDHDHGLAIYLDSTDEGMTPTKPSRFLTVSNLASEVRQLQDALALSMLECEEARQRLIDSEDSFRLEIEYLQERVQAGEVEITSLNEMLHHSNSKELQTSFDRATISQLEENIAGLNTIIETLQLRLAHKDSEVVDVKEESKRALNDLKMSTDQIINELQKQSDTYAAQIADQNNEISTLHLKLQTFDDSFTLQSTEHRAITARYEQAIMDLKELLEQTDSQYRENVTNLEESVSSIKLENEKLQQLLRTKENEIESNELKHSQELHDLYTEIEGMKHLITQRIQQYELKLEHKNEEIQQLHTQISSASSEKDDRLKMMDQTISELNSMVDARNRGIEELNQQIQLKDRTISNLRAEFLTATNHGKELEQRKPEPSSVSTRRPSSLRKPSLDRSSSFEKTKSNSSENKRPAVRRSLSQVPTPSTSNPSTPTNNHEKIIIQRLKSQLQDRERELQDIKFEHEKDILEFCDEVVKLKTLVDTKVLEFGEMKTRHEEIIVHSKLEVEILKKELNDVQHLHEVRLMEVLNDLETLQEDIRVRVGSVSSEVPLSVSVRENEAKDDLTISSEGAQSAAILTISTSRSRDRDRLDPVPSSSSTSSPRNSLDCESTGGGVTSPPGSVSKLESEVMKELKQLRCRFEEQEKTHENIRNDLQTQLESSQEEQQRSARRIEELERERRVQDEEMRRKMEEYDRRIAEMEKENKTLKDQLDSRLQLSDDPREVGGGGGKKRGGFFCGR